jgi:hypothetical protein
MRTAKKLGLLGTGTAVLVMAVVVPVFAQSSSTNYKLEESFFGTGGELDASSTSYKAKQSAGETAVGNASSANYQFNAGFNTTDQPLLEFAVNGGIYDLGILDAASTGTAVAAFSVRSYLSAGYIVTAKGASPSTTAGAAHTLAPMTAAGSSPGTEQFGINLVANTNPSIGSNPSQVPDSTFSFGSAASDYANPNIFKFLDGDTIAFSPKSSGQTNYALSIIANISRDTPAGQYGGTINLQVVPTF